MFNDKPLGKEPDIIENVNVSPSTSEAPVASVPTSVPSKNEPKEPAAVDHVGLELTVNPSAKEAERPDTFVTLTL